MSAHFALCLHLTVLAISVVLIPHEDAKPVSCSQQCFVWWIVSRSPGVCTKLLQLSQAVCLPNPPQVTSNIPSWNLQYSSYISSIFDLLSSIPIDHHDCHDSKFKTSKLHLNAKPANGLELQRPGPHSLGDLLYQGSLWRHH